MKNMGTAYDIRKRNAKKKMPTEVAIEIKPATSLESKKQTLEELKSMIKPKTQRLAMGGMAQSSVIKSRPLDKYGTIMEQEREMAEMPPKKYEGMSTDKGPDKIEEDEDMAPMLAEGGEVEDDYQDEEKHSSIAAAIMAKRKMMAEGGEVALDDKEEDSDFESRNEGALKENYDEDLTDVTQPADSNLKSDDISEDEHDMISKIRSKMRMRMGK